MSKLRYALSFGALAGFIYACVAWGYDGVQLALNHAAYPFLQFAIAVIPCTIAGAAVGWLAYRINHLLVSSLLWGLVGYFFGWIAIHTSFNLLMAALGILNPALREIVNYPVPYNPFILIVAVVLSAIAGLLEIPLVDASADAEAPLGRIFPMVFWSVIFLLAAIAPEDNFTSQLRQPVVATNAAIQYTLQHQGDQVDRKTQIATGMLAVKPLSGLIDRPYRLILGTYEESLYSSNVIIDFDGDWAVCTVVNGAASVCKRVSYADLQQAARSP
ncbi:MAG: hypothetical protein M1281_13675 [Chloroflexi bacterium]|nr:hypothetical protein [Chloroflexota bacterium]